MDVIKTSVRGHKLGVRYILRVMHSGTFGELERL